MMSTARIIEHQRLNKEVEERSMNIQKLFRDALQIFSHTSTQHNITAAEIFESYSSFELHQKAKEAQEKFDMILSNAMEQNRLPQYLSKLLQEWKTEAQAILKEYDDIVSQQNCNLEIQDRKYREKVEIHSLEQEMSRDKIENLIAELNKAGEQEVCTTRNMIVAHSKCVSDELWKQNETFLNDTSADKPFDSYLWKASSEILPEQELENAFQVDQTDVFNLRRELLSEVCKLRSRLEREKLNYILERQNLEQEIFYLKQKYNTAIPAMAKMKRKYFKIRDKKETLHQELKKLNQKIEKELASHTYYSGMGSQHPSRVSKDKQNQKTLKIFNLRKEEVQELMTEILIAEKFVYETILKSRKNYLPMTKFDTPKDFQGPEIQKYWNSFLDLAPKELFLDQIFDVMWKYREELQLCYELLRRNLDLSNHSKELKILLKDYHKLEKYGK